MIKFCEDEELKERVSKIVKKLNFSHIDLNRIFCFKSKGSKSKYVRARCWSLPRVWQEALKIGPYYIIEVIGEYYDNLTEEEKDKLLIHELLHIPKTFSGALRPHKGYISPSIINKLYKKLKMNDESL